MKKEEIIIRLTSEYFSVPEAIMKKKSGIIGAKKPDVITARHSAMVLIIKHTDLSFKEIGAIFGGRDRSTMYHVRDAIQDRLDTDRNFKRQFAELSQKIESELSPSPIEKRFQKEGYVFISASPR